MTRVKSILGAFTVVLCLGTVSVANAATYYVSTSGSDGSNCTAAQNIVTPKRTLNNAVTCLAPGDTLLVRGGTYTEGLDNPGLASGTDWSNKVRIANYSGETVWLTPSSGTYVLHLSSGYRYIEFDGINMDGVNVPYTTVALWNPGTSDHIRIQNAELIGPPHGTNCAVICGAESSEFISLRIHGRAAASTGCGTPCGDAGWYSGGSNNLIEGCDIYDVSMEGIQIYNGSGGTPTNNTIRNTQVHGIVRSGDGTGPGARTAGILITGINNQVYNNLVFGNGISNGSNAGIVVYSGSGNKVYNNTIYNNVESGLKLGTGASNTEVRNNILYATRSGSDYIDGGSATIQANNLIGTDPLFVSASANNFQLQAASPAVDRGTNLSVVMTDFAGIARPQGTAPDMGAYEYRAQQAQSSPPAPPTGVRIVSN